LIVYATHRTPKQPRNRIAHRGSAPGDRVEKKSPTGAGQVGWKGWKYVAEGDAQQG